MTLKTLVTGVAAAAAVGGAAMGVTCIASPAIASADDCVDQQTLQGVVDSIISPDGDFAAQKGQFISPALGFTSGKLANGQLRSLYARGVLPTDVLVGAPSCSGNIATSQVSALGKTMPITFVNDGMGWKVTASSANSVLAALK